MRLVCCEARKVTTKMQRTRNPSRQLFEPALGFERTRPRLAGRRIIIVGAGQRSHPGSEGLVGNGRAISLLFAREDAELTCVDASPAALEETCALIRAQGGKAHAEVCDIADAAAIPRLVARCAERMGGLDGIVIVVGISSGRPLDHMDAGTWDHEFAVNVRSNMLFAQAALERMEDGGSMLLISSISALGAGSVNPAYETSKAAQMALARSVAMAGQARGIRCNSLLPGLIDTPMGRSATARRPERAGRPVPFGRQGTGWEIAHAALFLMSDEASYVNAQALVVDGGLTAGVAMPVAED